MQKLQLSIPEPCHENWQNMTPTEQGRFCNACAKEVVDFSMMTDREVLNYFTTVTYDKVCGRALPAQLDRTISMPKDPKKRLFWYWNYVVMFFMFFSKTNASKAQNNVQTVAVADINNASAGKVGEVAINKSWIINGKVIDKEGNPVSFATVKIKANPTGLSADANGAYSIKVKPNDVLVVSAASFKPVEVPVGSQLVLNTVLEKGNRSDLKETIVIIAGWVSYGNFNEEIAPVNLKYNATLKVKDDKSEMPIDKAKVIIARSVGIDTFFTDKKGAYKLKGIKGYDEYYIKIVADGYEANEFIISGKDFKDRKKEWEVFLTKAKVETTQAHQPIILQGNISKVSAEKGPIYVVDGKRASNGDNINPDDIANITVLKAAEAGAIFGPEGSNGAVVITTRMAKTKNLDTVTVLPSSYGRMIKHLTGTMAINTEITRYSETKARIVTKLTDSLKIYPNPVQKGVAFSVSLKLKQTGTYNIQVADATGRIVLQKQTNIPSKQYIEQLQADSRWGSGVYYIRVFNNNNKLISKNSFVVQ